MSSPHQFLFQVSRLIQHTNLDTPAHRAILHTFFGPRSSVNYGQATFAYTVKEIAAMSHLSDNGTYHCLRSMRIKKIVQFAKVPGERYSQYSLTKEFSEKIDELRDLYL